MANQIAGGMKSLKVHIEVPGADSSIVAQEYARAEHLKITEINEHPLTHDGETLVTATIGDAPLVPRPGGPMLTKHLLDLLINWKGTVDKATIKYVAALGQYDKLPVPFTTKSKWEVSYSMQLHAVETSKDTWDIIKWFIFLEKQKTCTAVHMLCVGQACTPDWGGSSNPFVAKNGLASCSRTPRWPQVILTRECFVSKTTVSDPMDQWAPLKVW